MFTPVLHRFKADTLTLHSTHPSHPQRGLCLCIHKSLHEPTSVQRRACVACHGGAAAAAAPPLLCCSSAAALLQLRRCCSAAAPPLLLCCSACRRNPQHDGCAGCALIAPLSNAWVGSARLGSARDSAARDSAARPPLDRLGHNALSPLGLLDGRKDSMNSSRSLEEHGRFEAWQRPAAGLCEITCVSASGRVAHAAVHARHAACRRTGAASQEMPASVQAERAGKLRPERTGSVRPRKRMISRR